MKRLGATRVVLELDSSVVVNWIIGTRCDTWYLEAYWSEILKLLHQIDFRVEHVYHQGNCPVDFLACMGADGISSHGIALGSCRGR